MPRRQRRSAGSLVMSSEPKRIEPASHETVPARTDSNVVLPAPLGPTMPTASLDPTDRSTPDRATNSPYRLTRPVAWSTRPESIRASGDPGSRRVTDTSPGVRLQLGGHRHLGIVGV